MSFLNRRTQPKRTGPIPGTTLISNVMFITDIYKIVVRDADSINNHVDPRIFFDRAKAEEFAKQLWADGDYEDFKIGEIIIYREVPDTSLGWFRTAGMSRIEK